MRQSFWLGCASRPTRASKTLPPTSPLPEYSTDIASAWLVVERMRVLGWTFGIDDLGYSTDEKNLSVLTDAPLWRARFDTLNNERWAWQEAATAPLAICLAALEALGEPHP